MKKHIWFLLGFLACTSCINAESAPVDEEEEAEWWCNFYGTCSSDEKGSNIYGSAPAKSEKKRDHQE